MSFDLEDEELVPNFSGICPKCRNRMTHLHDLRCPECDNKRTMWCPRCEAHRRLRI